MGLLMFPLTISNTTALSHYSVPERVTALGYSGSKKRLCLYWIDGICEAVFDLILKDKTWVQEEKRRCRNNSGRREKEVENGDDDDNEEKQK